MANNVLCEVTVNLIIGHQNLINSSLKPSEHLNQYLKTFPQDFLFTRMGCM